MKTTKDIDDRVIGGITFKGRTYKHIGYEWIQYRAAIDDNRALSIRTGRNWSASGHDARYHSQQYDVSIKIGSRSNLREKSIIREKRG